MIDDPLLVEMIFCPILFYGGSQEHDIDFDQFSILFRAIFLEGLARPLAGIQTDPEDAGPPLQGARRRASAAGGRRARSPSRTARCEKVVLEDGAELEARNVLSSAGWTETMRLCDDGQRRRAAAARPAVVRRVDLDSRRPAALARLRQDDRLLQRFGEVPLREARRSGRSAQRHDLLAEQFRLRRAAGRGHDADLGAGQLRPLGGARRGGLSRWRSSTGTTGWRPRRCGSCPISAAR